MGCGIVTGPAVTADEATFSRFGRQVTLHELQDSGELQDNYIGWTTVADAEYVVRSAGSALARRNGRCPRRGFSATRTPPCGFDRGKAAHAWPLDFLLRRARCAPGRRVGDVVRPLSSTEVLDDGRGDADDHADEDARPDDGGDACRPAPAPTSHGLLTPPYRPDLGRVS